MNPCGINISISALACALAEGKSDTEVDLLSAFFTQLGDSLATISAARKCNSETKKLTE